MWKPFAIGDQWPTKDPFLFVAHHNDAYPLGDDEMRPVASLTGRSIGNDFAGIDGWNMYHGSGVPGFPQHPHRGFETVTHLRAGAIDHSDSLGATARFGPGDTQWMTAGAGIVHSEMFPLLHHEAANPLELFQIWLNLPQARKMVDPYFTMMWSESTPAHIATDEQGAVTRITTIAGSYNEVVAAPPPPDSWAADGSSGVAIWHIEMSPDARWVMPAAAEGVERMLYAYAGSSLSIAGDEGSAGDTEAGGHGGGHTLASGHGVEVPADRLSMTADGRGVSMILLQGRPIGEPVAQYGPFVMNDRSGLEQAVADYQSTRFGGWPWGRDDPVHPRTAGRFAVHPDGRREEPTEAPTV